MSVKYKMLPVQVRASFWFLVCAFLQKGISVITTPIFTRLLTASEYGQYSVFGSWMGIIGIFVSLNLSAGVYSQGLVKFEERENEYSSSSQGLTLTLVIAWLAVYLLFHEFWNSLFSLTTIQMLAMFSMIWTAAVANFWMAAQRVHYQYRIVVIATLAVSIAKPVFGIFMVCHADDKVTARIAGLAVVELAGYTWMFVSQIWKGRKFFDAGFWKYELLFNLPLIPHYLSQTVLNSADRIMIERMTGSENAGIYSLAYSISLIMTLFNVSLLQVMSPWMYKKIKVGRVSDISSVAYATLFMVAAANIILIVFAPEMVALFAPETYYDAVWVIPPVAMSVYFMYSYDLFAVFAFYYEKTKFIMMASVAGAVLNILLNYIFIGWFGYMAAGYTTLVCFIVYSIGHYYFMNKICDKCCGGVRPYDVRKIVLFASLFMLLGFVLVFTYRSKVLRYGIVMLLAIATVWKRKKLKDMIGGILKNTPERKVNSE